MTDSEPNITYEYAYIYLKPSNPDYFFGEDWREKFTGGVLEDSGFLGMTIDDFLLNMHGIKILTSGRQKLNSDEAIIESAQRLLGDFGEGLKRCVELCNEGAIQESLFFRPSFGGSNSGEVIGSGLADYSTSNFQDKLKGKKVGDWVKEARDISSDPRKYIPNNIELPVGAEIKFTPTYQAIRDMTGLYTRKGDCHTIEGSTFADSVENFLGMYDAIRTHLDWKEGARNDRRRESFEISGQFNPHDKIPVGELVLPVPETASS